MMPDDAMRRPAWIDEAAAVEAVAYLKPYDLRFGVDDHVDSVADIFEQHHDAHVATLPAAPDHAPLLRDCRAHVDYALTYNPSADDRLDAQQCLDRIDKAIEEAQQP